jgi:hypothetical protein
MTLRTLEGCQPGPAPMPRSPIRYHRVLARRLPPLTGLWIGGLSNPCAGIWVAPCGGRSDAGGMEPAVHPIPQQAKRPMPMKDSESQRKNRL